MVKCSVLVYLAVFSLSCLYNCFEESNQMRFFIFKDILHYADSIQRIDIILPYAEKIDDMIKQWNLSKDQWVDFYHNFITVLQKYPL